MEIPKFEVLSGEEAIAVLNTFIDELEVQKGEELTEKQAKALIKLAKGLISSIEAEKPLRDSSKETDIMRHVRNTVVKYISDARARFGSAFTDGSSI